jgi:hypothetical protein
LDNVFQDIIPATPNSIVNETIIPTVTGIANVASIAIVDIAATPTTVELIKPNNPKYHVNVNIIRRMIVANK